MAHFYLVTSVKGPSSLHHTKSMLLLGAKAKDQGLKYSWEEIRFPASVRESKCSESTQKRNGLLY